MRTIHKLILYSTSFASLRLNRWASETQNGIKYYVIFILLTLILFNGRYRVDTHYFTSQEKYIFKYEDAILYLFLSLISLLESNIVFRPKECNEWIGKVLMNVYRVGLYSAPLRYKYSVLRCLQVIES